MLSATQLLQQRDPLWFCVKTQPKNEHLAAAALRRHMSLECFSPRIRFRKNTRRGPVWFTEAMFPSYLFARFVYPEQHKQVQYAPGVSTIVRFGSQVATVPDTTIVSLRAASGDEEVIVFDPELRVGDPIRIAEGAFQGLEAVITQVLPAKERVKVLLTFLGREVEAEIHLPRVVPAVSPRSGTLAG